MAKQRPCIIQGKLARAPPLLPSGRLGFRRRLDGIRRGKALLALHLGPHAKIRPELQPSDRGPSLHPQLSRRPIGGTRVSVRRHPGLPATGRAADGEAPRPRPGCAGSRGRAHDAAPRGRRPRRPGAGRCRPGPWGVPPARKLTPPPPRPRTVEWTGLAPAPRSLGFRVRWPRSLLPVGAWSRQCPTTL